MFNAIRRMFTAITTAAVVKLTADVTRLEKLYDYEFDFGCKMARRYADVSLKLKTTRQSLIETRRSIEVKDEQFALAESAYRSLLCDWNDQCDEIERLKLENQKLKRELNEAIDLTRRYSELADTYYKSYENALEEMDLSRTRAEMYRVCYIETKD